MKLLARFDRVWAVSATSRTRYGCVESRPSASSASIAWICRAAAATARPRFADSALITRFRSPRTDRETWRDSISSNEDPPPKILRNVPTFSTLFQVTTPLPRRIRHVAGISMSARRSHSSPASDTSRTNSRCVRPDARLSDPWPRKRPRNQAIRQCSAARSQSNAGSGVAPSECGRRRSPRRIVFRRRGSAAPARPANSAPRQH